MINRILIRMKVVQMLYSYMISRSEFKLATPSIRPTRESQLSYELYAKLLALVLQLSGSRYEAGRGLVKDATRQAIKTGLTDALYANNEVRSFLLDNEKEVILDNRLLTHLYAVLTDNAYVKEYKRKVKKDVETDVTFWNVVIDTLIVKNQELLDTLRKDDFSMTALSNAVKMLKDTFKDYSEVRLTLDGAKRSLVASLDKAYELYNMLLMLPVELTRLQRNRLEDAKEKYIPTSEDLNPNLRFINNAYVAEIEGSEKIQQYLKAHPINWDEDYLLIRRMLDDILRSDLYKDYMAAEVNTREDDFNFWRAVMKNFILPGDALAEMLESKSVYWNDDVEIMGTFVIKTIKKIASTGVVDDNILPMYKDDDDARFGADLFTDAIVNRQQYTEYIHRFIDSDQWDPERIAYMDVVIMMTAVSELINFPAIPVAVTMNEYIEIANSYSTPRSGQFVNGMLYSISKYLKEQGIIQKEC